jgi:hypothetical protein
MRGRLRGSREGSVCQGALNRKEPLAVTRPRAARLEVTEDPRASLVDAPREDACVVPTRMSAAVAERGILAFAADFQRAASPVELVTAVPAQPEHTRYVDETVDPLERVRDSSW